LRTHSCFLHVLPPPRPPLFPYTTLFRSAAAYVAGVLSLEDAIRVVYHRARLMQQATGLGQMMTVDLPLDEVERLLEPFADRLTPDRKSTRLNSSHVKISYAVFCLKKKKK